jgi:hypothetical protein
MAVLYSTLHPKQLQLSSSAVKHSMCDPVMLDARHMLLGSQLLTYRAEFCMPIDFFLKKATSVRVLFYRI